MSFDTNANANATTSIGFDGQVAIVTGGGGGLGRAYALELARRGARVLVNDLGCARDGTGSSRESADKVVAEITAAGGQAAANYESVATPEGGERIVRAALEAFGRVDILINNAGIVRDKSLAKLTPDMWDGVISVHLDGAYHVTRPAFLAMREQNYGRIVFITSATGLYGNFGQTNYGAAKLGVVGLMNSLKPEAARYEIQVNAVAPLAFTRINEDVIPVDLQDALKPESVAPLVVYLCSKECAVSGHVYNAGMGYFSRAAIVTSPAAGVSLRGQMPTVEGIRDEWDRIDALGNEVYEDAVSALFAMVPSENGDVSA